MNDKEPAVKLDARTIPFPSSISTEARAALERLVGEDGRPRHAGHRLLLHLPRRPGALRRPLLPEVCGGLLRRRPRLLADVRGGLHRYGLVLPAQQQGHQLRPRKLPLVQQVRSRLELLEVPGRLLERRLHLPRRRVHLRAALLRSWWRQRGLVHGQLNVMNMPLQHEKSDIIKLTVFVAGDPKLGGKMDFAGMNDAFKMYFGTAENPNTVARSTVQVAALAGPAFLVEIEATAAK